jgi:hypothetical protein
MLGIGICRDSLHPFSIFITISFLVKKLFGNFFIPKNFFFFILILDALAKKGHPFFFWGIFG